MLIKKMFIKIDKKYTFPNNLDETNLLCLNDKDILEDILQLFITQIEFDLNENNNGWKNLYLSEFKDKEKKFHESFIKSHLEDYIFYTIQGTYLELFDKCEQLKQLRYKFIDTMEKTMSNLSVNLSKKEIERWDDEIFNYYYKLFQTKKIEKMGTKKPFYFNDEQE